jgi:ABC-type glycerol-3-phosphate transport system substrate-binding protein
MKTWKKCAFIGILAIIVFAFIGCPPEKTVETGITITGDLTGVDLNKLNEIKAFFERYHSDIRVIEVRIGGTNGRVGDTIKMAKNSINDWEPEDDTEARQMIDFMYNSHPSA